MTDWRFIFEKYVLRKERPNYEPKVRKALKKIRGSLFVDIGANTGLYTRMLQKNFDRIEAFEPEPGAFKQLEALSGSTVITHNLALSDREGETALYSSPPGEAVGRAITILPVFNFRPGFDSSIETVQTGQKTFTVKTRTVDSLNFPCISLAKIDVEGAEFLVLEGCRKTMERGGIEWLLVELHDRDRKRELEEILSRYGFHLEWVDPDHVLAQHRAPPRATAAT